MKNRLAKLEKQRPAQDAGLVNSEAVYARVLRRAEAIQRVEKVEPKPQPKDDPLYDLLMARIQKRMEAQHETIERKCSYENL